MQPTNANEAVRWLSTLSHYDLGTVLGIEAGGGTAAAKVIVTSERGRYLLRSRRPMSSGDEIVTFDHAVILAIADAGLPTARPEPSDTGQTWVRDGECAFEVLPFIEGLKPFTQGNHRQIQSAARTLARFHRATAALNPLGRKDWPREHRIRTMADTLAQTIADTPPAGEGLNDARYMLHSAEELSSLLTDETVATLPHVITHGDYTPANVLFQGDEVGGIFDFDWVSHQARMVDLGEALQFFAFRRATALDANSIWSLVEAWQPDVAGARHFLTAYQAVWPLSDAEAAALPLFMRETWLGVRIRAMRKVPSDQRLLILTKGALAPLQWLEENASLITELVGETVLKLQANS
ncbi:MAG: phosphotransferase [Anaerolineae bacterium]